jgi:hypothetical protein
VNGHVTRKSICSLTFLDFFEHIEKCNLGDQEAPPPKKGTRAVYLVDDDDEEEVTSARNKGKLDGRS